MALVVSLYDKQLLKNHNFRRHIAENGVQNHENGMGQQQQQQQQQHTENLHKLFNTFVIISLLIVVVTV